MPGLVASCRSSSAAVAAFSMVPMANPASSMFSIAKWPPDFARFQTIGHRQQRTAKGEQLDGADSGKR